MVVVAGFLGLFISLLAAFFMEYREKVFASPENREKLELLKNYSQFSEVRRYFLKLWNLRPGKQTYKADESS